MNIINVSAVYCNISGLSQLLSHYCICVLFCYDCRSKFNLDVDGFPCYEESVHVRLKALRAAHTNQIQKLVQKLKKAREKVRIVQKVRIVCR